MVPSMQISPQEEGETTSCWLGGLYSNAVVDNDGLLAKADDNITFGQPGDTEYRETILSTLQENTADSLVTMTTTSNITDVTNVTSGISALYYTDKFVVAESQRSSFIRYWSFQSLTDGSVGPDLKEDSGSTHLIPREATGVSGTNTGTGRIGVFVDGTPALSMRNGSKLVSGIITGLTVVNGGINYGTATAQLFEPSGATASVTVEGGVVTGLTITNNTKYTEIPTVRISEGEGALFDLTSTSLVALRRLLLFLVVSSTSTFLFFTWTTQVVVVPVLFLPVLSTTLGRSTP